jgi:DNA-binding NarL/FixJ family response regulator
VTETQSGSGCATAVVAAHATRILLVDDHPLIRQAVRETLEQEPDMVVCGEAGDEAAAKELVESLHPEMALVDLSLGDTSGLDLIKWMVEKDPAMRVLVLSMHDESHYGERSYQAGARGYVNKRETPETIVAAIRAILAGRIYLNPGSLRRNPQRTDERGL